MNEKMNKRAEISEEELENVNAGFGAFTPSPWAAMAIDMCADVIRFTNRTSDAQPLEL